MEKALEDAVAKIQKKFGKGTIRKGSEIAPVDRVPSGVFALDCALGSYEGVPGFPRGRITILAGEESSAKTLVALKVIAEFQRLGEPTVLVDAEGSWDPIWGRKIGIDPDALLIQSAECAEQAIDIMDELIRAMPGGCIVVDSMAALTPSTEIEDSSFGWQQGLAARIFNKGFRKFQAALNSATKDGSPGPTIICIQQFRTKFDRMRGGIRVMPGGAGQKFAASCIVSMWAGKPVYFVPGKGPQTKVTQDEKAECQVIGNTFHFEVTKNKTAIPKRRGSFELYNAPFSDDATDTVVSPGSTNHVEQVLRAGIRYGFATRAGVWYSMGDTRLGQGERKAVRFLMANPKMMVSLRDLVVDYEAEMVGTSMDSDDGSDV
jgi:recombination protein RecA